MITKTIPPASMRVRVIATRAVSLIPEKRITARMRMIRIAEGRRGTPTRSEK